MTSMDAQLKKETLCLHGGQQPDPATGSRAVPIHQTTSYLFRDTEHAANLFSLKELGYIYTRIMNPTTEVFEKRMAALEGGVGALAMASGMAAISAAVLTITQCGDEIVSADNLYGGTYTFFNHTLKRFGIKVKMVDSGNLNAMRKAVTAKTKLIYAETVGNPKLNVTDIEALAKIAHDNGIPLMIDNTATPYIIRPIEHGADIVVHSATKFIGGHGNSIGGAVIDSGKFNWTNGKFPLISEPDPSYHDLNFVEALKPMGNVAYIFKVRLSILRPMGAAMSPFNAFLFLQGLETLHLRMPRHCENALAVAQFLEKNKAVSWVNYPGLDSSPEKTKADKYLPNGAGAIIGFGIKGGAEAGKKFINSLKLISHLANIGDAKTLAIHPASTTHSQLKEEEQATTGVTPDYVRLSIGLEHVDDLKNDIEQALKKAQKR